MSNIHILNKDVDNKNIQCVFHIQVPVGNNSAGIPWFTAIMRHFSPIPVMEWNDTTDNEAISSGIILERPTSVQFSSINLTSAERLAEIQAAYAEMQSEILADLAIRLEFYGMGVN